MILKKYIKSVLLEMSRPRKKAFAQYGHPGLKRDALFAHWVFSGFNEYGFDQLVESCEEKSPEERVKFLNEFCLKQFEESLRQIDSRQEVSCNLVDPNKSNGVGTNYGGGGVDPWGYIGFLLRPKVVTMGYSDNMGTDIVDVGGGRMRKRTRSYGEEYGEYFLKNRENFLDTLENTVKSNFPLEDDEAYMKSVEGDVRKENQFYYNQSEFIVVPKEIVGVIWLDGEYTIFGEEYIGELFEESDLESLGMSEEDIFEGRRSIEKDYLRKFCSERGIKFYESDPGSEKIFDVPRTQRDL